MMKAKKVNRFLIFLLIWTVYSCCYLLRKPFGIIKGSIKEDFNLTESSLGYINLSFSLPYSFVSFGFSYIGDLIGPKLILGGSLICSAVSSSLMGLSPNYATLLGLIFALGTFQATTWPAACSILATWFSEKSLTSVMGLFGTSLLTGSVLSATITIHVMEIYGWRNVFYFPAGVVFAIGLIVLLFANQNPHKIDSSEHPEQEMKKDTKSNCFKVLLLPVVPYVTLTLCCVKSFRNAIFFWLPYYLTQTFDFSRSEAGYTSLLFEVGGLTSVLLTLFVDRCMRSKELLAVLIFNCCLGCSTALLFLGDSRRWFIYGTLFISGALSSSSLIILCGSVPAKLGSHFGSRSSIVGVVNGVGSLGNVIEGPIVSLLSQAFGIRILIHYLFGVMALGTVFSIKALVVHKKLNLEIHSKSNNDQESKL